MSVFSRGLFPSATWSPSSSLSSLPPVLRPALFFTAFALSLPASTSSLASPPHAACHRLDVTQLRKHIELTTTCAAARCVSVDGIAGRQHEREKPLDWEAFWAAQSTQPLRVVASDLRAAEVVKPLFVSH